MSGGFRARSMSTIESDQKQSRKPLIKAQKKPERSPETEEKRKQPLTPPALSRPVRNLSAPSILRHPFGNQLLRGNNSMNASCSSDASSDSSHSRASTGKSSRSSLPVRRKPVGLRSDKVECKVEKGEKGEKVDGGGIVGEGAGAGADVGVKKRCGWVTANTDPLYAKFHDEEWGFPIHDDRKLFELLSYAVALAELAWPTILSRRELFREVFWDFNPVPVSKLNEKKIGAAGSPGSTVLSELKLRNIVENARQVCKIIDEFGSFDKYIWGFMNHKPTVNKFRYPRQVPIKISKADVISKDLVKRGFRGVGPTVVYSFMQAAGLTNDHLVTCFRFLDCIAGGDGTKKEDPEAKVEEEKPSEIVKLELARSLDEISICSD